MISDAGFPVLFDAGNAVGVLISIHRLTSSRQLRPQRALHNLKLRTTTHTASLDSCSDRHRMLGCRAVAGVVALMGGLAVPWTSLRGY